MALRAFGTSGTIFNYFDILHGPQGDIEAAPRVSMPADQPAQTESRRSSALTDLESATW